MAFDNRARDRKAQSQMAPEILAVPLPLISIDAMAASAPSKVALALDRMGLKRA